MKRNSILQGAVASFFVLLLILDTKTAIIDAQEGISICLRSVIPSLFPFIVLTGILGNAIIGTKWKLLQPLSRLCGIPHGSESILLLGLISGYPVGAQLVFSAYNEGKLNRQDAQRMLAFCSNAGPAFTFGILGSMFGNMLVPLVLWFTHIISALMVAAILPDKSRMQCNITSQKNFNVTESLEKAIKIMANICGWVILFRILICLLNRWLFWLLPLEMQVLISGALELANGCIYLAGINSEGVKFLLAGAMLSFGGLCVAMQTVTVTRGLGCRSYFPGKVMQTSFSFALNSIAQYLLFSRADIHNIPISLTVLCIIVPFGIAMLVKRKKVVAFA